jgi:transcriptional regulator with XRE-family HTH domain|tara:strand:+ start:240 stop:515 length:276 start_codon:yes stop_codon:yes gene_type:complete
MTDNINFAWGNLIREIRKEKGINIKQLSELAGVAATTIGGVERKGHNTSIQVLEKLLFALGYELEAMVIGNPKPLKFFSAKTIKRPFCRRI